MYIFMYSMCTCILICFNRWCWAPKRSPSLYKRHRLPRSHWNPIFPLWVWANMHLLWGLLERSWGKCWVLPTVWRMHSRSHPMSAKGEEINVLLNTSLNFNHIIFVVVSFFTITGSRYNLPRYFASTCYMKSTTILFPLHSWSIGK